MAHSVGRITPKITGPESLSRARARAALIPDLLVEAQRIATTVASGWHGRRQRGSGDSFWQFRPYDVGESIAKIDWRRSARDANSIYMRDQEWEAAHTIWVWVDDTPSMMYQSDLAPVSKQSRALVIALAMVEILSRSGERVGWPGVTNAIPSRNAAERIAAELATAGPGDTSAFPPTDQMRNRSELIMMSDFLEPIETTLENISATAELGVRGSLVHVIDPAEESFPFTGRTEFLDPELGTKLTFGRAETIMQDYQTVFSARQAAISDHCRKLGWNYVIHHTDHLASSVLIDLHTRLSREFAS